MFDTQNFVNKLANLFKIRNKNHAYRNKEKWYDYQ